MMNNMNPVHARQIADMPQLPKLTDAERGAVANAYARMFMALTYANLAMGKKLGQSWYNANQQIKSFVGAQNEFNPAAIELNKTIENHHQELSKKMMTHPNRDRVINATPDKRNKMRDMANNEMRNALAEIKKIITKYHPIADKIRAEQSKLAAERAKFNMKTPAMNLKNGTAKLNAMSREKIMLHIMALNMQKQNQRAA